MVFYNFFLNKDNFGKTFDIQNSCILPPFTCTIIVGAFLYNTKASLWNDVMTTFLCEKQDNMQCNNGLLLFSNQDVRILTWNQKRSIKPGIN